MCWIAPLIPQAMYRSGAIRSPVWPIWSACGRQPRFVTTREPPTAPPSSPASSSSSANPSALPTPRPPPTTTRASASETLPRSGASRRDDADARDPRRSASARTSRRRRGAASGGATDVLGATVSSLTGPSSRRLLEQAAAPALAGEPLAVAAARPRRSSPPAARRAARPRARAPRARGRCRRRRRSSGSGLDDARCAHASGAYSPRIATARLRGSEPQSRRAARAPRATTAPRRARRSRQTHRSAAAIDCWWLYEHEVIRRARARAAPRRRAAQPPRPRRAPSTCSLVLRDESRTFSSRAARRRRRSRPISAFFARAGPGSDG